MMPFAESSSTINGINVSQLPFFPFSLCEQTEHSVAILGIYIGIQELLPPPPTSQCNTKEMQMIQTFMLLLQPLITFSIRNVIMAAASFGV